MNLHSFSLAGVLPDERWQQLLQDATVAIGMTPHGEAARWCYPTADGLGGTGSTIVQPITESFMALDTWPDHRGAYLLVCSCRQFDPHDIKRLLPGYGLLVAGEVGHILRIPGQHEIIPNLGLGKS